MWRCAQHAMDFIWDYHICAGLKLLMLLVSFCIYTTFMSVSFSRSCSRNSFTISLCAASSLWTSSNAREMRQERGGEEEKGRRRGGEEGGGEEERKEERWKRRDGRVDVKNVKRKNCGDGRRREEEKRMAGDRRGKKSQRINRQTNLQLAFVIQLQL